MWSKANVHGWPLEGLPLFAWNRETFISITKAFGANTQLLEVDPNKTNCRITIIRVRCIRDEDIMNLYKGRRHLEIGARGVGYLELHTWMHHSVKGGFWWTILSRVAFDGSCYYDGEEWIKRENMEKKSRYRCERE